MKKKLATGLIGGIMEVAGKFYNHVARPIFELQWEGALMGVTRVWDEFESSRLATMIPMSVKGLISEFVNATRIELMKQSPFQDPFDT